MNEKILVVDDEKDMRELVELVLKTEKTENYQIVMTETAKKALDIFDNISPDLIISDIRMPEMDGFAFLEKIRSRDKGAAVPFLFLSAYSQRENLSQARSLAVDDYLYKPFAPKELLEAVHVRLKRRKDVLLFDTREAHLQTVEMLANAIEMRDHNTRGHIDRVRKIATLFGKKLGWDQSELRILDFGAILHDVGKLKIEAKILNKQGSLNQEEWDIMRQHPENGAEMLEGIDHLKEAIPYVLYHHERWDGKGYPHGLKGEKTPIAGRMLSLVDNYDAVRNDRSYHKGCSKEKTLRMIEENSGIIFDPVLVKKFLEISDQLD